MPFSAMTAKAPVNEEGGSMLAVTICTSAGQRRWAEVNAAGWAARTGLAVRILGEVELAATGLTVWEHLKFRLFELCPEAETILYFDPDWLCLQEWNPRELAGRVEIVGIADRAESEVVRAEAAKCQVPVEDYLHSGLFIANRRHHAAWLGKAEHDQAEWGSAFPERSYLNRARLILEIPMLILPGEYGRRDFDRVKDLPAAVAGRLAESDRVPAERIAETVCGWLAATAGTKAGPVLERTRRVGPGTPAMPAEWVDHWALLEAAVAEEVVRAEEGTGRGIVVCGGGMKYFPCAYVCVRLQRHLGCTLPVEVWYLGDGEMTAQMRVLLAPFGVTCTDGNEVAARHPVRRLGGWELKCFALLHCGFAEALLLDADNCPVLDPTALFDEPEYREKGAIFWPDYGRLGPERAIWQIAGIAYRDEPEFESGQILVNKRLCARELQLAMHINDHSDFYYRHVHGDKETFHLAWRKLGTPYAMPGRGIQSLAGTMCQHDLQGRRVFQHRNFAKWTLDGNRRIGGFLLEEECLGFIAELRAQWREFPGGQRCYDAAQASPEEQAAAARLCEGKWIYERVGHDQRALSFLPHGLVGEGAAGCEVFWCLRTAEGRVRLEVWALEHRTFSAVEEADGSWQGRWEYCERMPVLLRSRAADETPDSPVPAVRFVSNTPDCPVFWELLIHAQGERFFDVGANGGMVSGLLSASFHEVVAFEPAIESFTQLARLSGKNIRAVHAAVSDHEGTVTLDQREGACLTGQLTSGDGLNWGNLIATREVPCLTLDSATREHGAPDMVKIDVEGHELKVLHGARGLIGLAKTRWLIEVHREEFGPEIEALFATGHDIRRFNHTGYLPGSPESRAHFYLDVMPR